MSVMYAYTTMCVCVCVLHLSNYLVEIVHVEALAGQPEADVLVTGRVFGVRHELQPTTAATALGELLQKALVCRPEQPDVGDLQKSHSSGER